MAARKNLSKSATREVTVKLHGWPAEIRTLSVIEACWMVDLEFKSTDRCISHTVFQGDDYVKALARYNAFKVIVA